MRLDKYLKVSQIIKRRVVGKSLADKDMVLVNGKSVKPAYTVKVGDIIEMHFGEKVFKVEFTNIATSKVEMYKPIE